SRRVSWLARRVLCKRRGVSEQTARWRPQLFSSGCKTASNERTRFPEPVGRDGRANPHYFHYGAWWRYSSANEYPAKLQTHSNRRRRRVASECTARSDRI